MGSSKGKNGARFLVRNQDIRAKSAVVKAALLYGRDYLVISALPQKHQAL